MNPLTEPLAGSPAQFPLALDTGRDLVSLVRLSEADYANASFLDGRILTPAARVFRAAFADVAQAVSEAALRESAHYIFHIGHVGSTLLSRLLGAHPAVFALREPEPLRTLAQAWNEPPPRWDRARLEMALGIFLKLWSRTFREDQRSVIKATSFVSELAPQILARPSQPRAIFMIASPESYLATILGAPNSPGEARMLAPLRLKRLNARMGTDFTLGTMSMGEIVAMSWACETTALAAAAQSAGGRVHWLDFDRFLAAANSSLAECFAHLGFDTPSSLVAKILSGPIMSRYSKAQEYQYNSALRSDVLNQARATQSGEIRRGLNWLEQACATAPQLRQVLDGLPN
jgi:hypothetical protein